MSVKGVTFGGLHSYRDFGLLLQPGKVIGCPEVKTNMVDIEGADSSLDYTEFFGEPKYENLTHKFPFVTMASESEFMSIFAKVKNALHGKKMKIVLDDDPECYYIGRCFVSNFTNEKSIGVISVECECDPWRYKLKSQTVMLCGTNMLNLASAEVTANGTWTATETGFSFERGDGTGGSFVYFSIPVRRGQTYAFSSDYPNGGVMYVYKNQLYGDLVVKTQYGEPCIFTAEESGVYIFGLYASSGITSIAFDNVMLCEGGEVKAFEAYDAESKTVTATFSNAKRAAIPTMYTANTATVESDSVFVTLSAGGNAVPEFTFYEGDTTLTFNGNGVVVVEWLERGI